MHIRVYGRQQCWQWHNAADDNLKHTHTHNNTNKGSLDPGQVHPSSTAKKSVRQYNHIRKTPEPEQGNSFQNLCPNWNSEGRQETKLTLTPLPTTRQGWAERIWCRAEFILLLFKVYLLSPSKIQDYFIISSEKLSEDRVYFIAVDVCTSAKTLSPDPFQTWIYGCIHLSWKMFSSLPDMDVEICLCLKMLLFISFQAIYIYI